MNPYKECTAKLFSYFATDTLNNPFERMRRFDMKNCNMIIADKQQKYQHYHMEKMINMNML